MHKKEKKRMTKFSRTASGKYSVAGKTYPTLIGTRAQVWHGTSYKTTGDLTKKHLMKNKHGRIVSRSKHATAKREKRLARAGYLTRKGKFGSFRVAVGERKRRGRRGTTKRRKHRGGMGSSASSRAPFDANVSEV